MATTLYEYSNPKKHSLSSDEAISLEKFLTAKGLDKALQVSPTQVKTAQYVGVIKYKKHQFEILPKLLKDKEADDSKIRQNLFYMLSYTKKLEIKQSELSKMAKSQNPFLEVLISHYANTLYDAYLRYVPKNYVEEQENLNFLKGKLNFKEHIKKNITNKAKFHCIYDEFCEDTLLNQTFLFVTVMLGRISSPVNRKKLKLIENILSEISFNKTTYQQVKNIKLTRNQTAFSQPFELAKMFLQNSSIEMSSKSFKTISIVFDMNKLFEEYVCCFIEKNKSKINENIDKVSQQKGKRLIEKSYNLETDESSDSKIGNTYLDILIEFKDGDKIILDTKYKLHNGNKNDFSNADVFQMLAYENIHATDIAILLYPQEEEPFAWRHKVQGTDNHIIQTCIDLSQDISSKEVQEHLAQRINQILTWSQNHYE